MSRNSGTFAQKGEENKVKIEGAIASNDWNARKEGYKAAAANFRKVDLCGKNWDLFNHLVTTLTAERNVIALEKGLEAVLAFVENCSIVDDDIVKNVLNNVVKKALSDVKLRIKELANRICTALIDRKKHEMVTDMLLQGIEAQNVKLAFSCIRTLTNALADYGPSYINISAVASSAVGLCQDKAMFQQDVKDLLKEIYKWNGLDGMERYMTSLDKPQRKAMEAEFSKVDKDRAERSQFARPVSVDSYDTSWSSMDSRPNSARPFAPLPKIPLKTIRPASTSQATKNVAGRISSTTSRQSRTLNSSKKLSYRACGDRPTRRNQQSVATKMEMEDIFIMMESKQWGDRKEAVDELYTRINSNAAINAADYDKIIKRLRVLILEDTNVVLVSKAIKCVAAFAQSHNKVFQQHAPLMMTLLLEKFKEKKSIIIDSTREAIDVIYLNYQFGSIARYIALSLVSPNPSVKAETAFFVQRCFTRPTTALLKGNHWKPIVQGLVNNLTFPEQNVREQSMKALGTILKALGEDLITPYLTKIPQHQALLILKYCNDTERAHLRPSSHAGTETSLENGIVSEDLHSTSTSTTDHELFWPNTNSLLPGFKAQSLPGQPKQVPNNLVLQANQKENQGPESFNSSGNSDSSVPRNMNCRNSRNNENHRNLNITSILSCSNNLRQSLSPSSQQKLATFQCTVKQLKEARKKVQPLQDGQPQESHPLLVNSLGTTEEKITRKLQALEGTVSKSIVEIRQLSPQLYKELEYLGNQSSGDVIRTLNQKLYEMESLLKSMAFEMCPLSASTV